MKIEQITAEKIKILLDVKDLLKYDIIYEKLDYNNPDTKRIILELLDIAKVKTGFDSSGGKLFVEVFPDMDGGCVFYFSILEKSSRKNQRSVTKFTQPVIYIFDNINTVISASDRFYRSYCHRIYKSMLFLNANEKYALVVYPLDAGDRSVTGFLDEYATRFGTGICKLSFLQEHSKLLIGQDAIEKLSALA